MINDITASINNNKRPTVGVLINQIEGNFQVSIWHGIADAAKEYNVNVIIFSGKTLNSMILNEARENIMFSLARQQNLDGLIICSGVISSYIGYDAFYNFFQNYRHYPVVSIGMKLPGIPSIIFDNWNAAKEIVEHLVNKHNARKIAFIKAFDTNLENSEFYNGYREALSEHNIAFDEQLVVEGDFSRIAGNESINILLDERKVEFDAIISCSDEMALGVLNELKRRGIKVPDDIIVIGSNNSADPISTTPSLTAVHYPMYESMGKAIGLLLSYIKGEDVEQVTKMHLDFIIRNTCPCRNAVDENLLLPFPLSSLRITSMAKHHERVTIINALVEHSLVERKYRDIVEQLFSDLYDAIIEDVMSWYKNTFLLLFNEILNETAQHVLNRINWEDFLAALKKIMIIAVSADQQYRIENIYKQALFELDKIRVLKSNNVKLLHTSQSDLLSSFLMNVSYVTNVIDLFELISKKATRVGMQYLYLVLFEPYYNSVLTDPCFAIPEGTLHLAVEKGRYRYSQEGLCPFKFSSILPEKYIPNDNRYTWLTRSIFNKSCSFGYVVYDVSFRSELVYITLHDMIIAGFQSIAKHNNSIFSSSKREIRSSRNSFASKVINYIQEKDDLNVTLDQISNHMFISKRHLQSKLNEEGTSFREILLLIKKERAIDFLQNSAKSIPEIADQLGFEEVTSFVKAFKKWTGITPGKYRDKKN